MELVKLNDIDKFTLLDHWENTKGDFIKCYNLKQLMYMEWKLAKTLKKNLKILPVRVDSSTKLFNYREWYSSKPYSIRYIRVDEVENMLAKMSGKKVHISFE